MSQQSHAHVGVFKLRSGFAIQGEAGQKGIQFFDGVVGKRIFGQTTRRRQVAGLPRDPSNLTPTRGLPENAFADYTVEKLYAFLSSFTLDREPGSKFEYSNVGMALLGHILALKTGTNYEALVVERICRPLKMNSTRITLTPELQARLARGHDKLGKPAPNWNFQVYDGAGGLRSTAN